MPWCIGDLVASLALAMWLRGLRCVMVLAEVMGIKGAFGVAFGDRTSSTLDTHHLGQGRTQLRGSALTCELQFWGFRSPGWFRG